ncbi:MAG: hypothetical protein ACD_32C00086G0001, partial [uncultured bacterium]
MEKIRLIKYSLLLVSIFLLHALLLINFQFTLWPEMVVYPYLINKGFLIYKDIINPYPPFFSEFLSFFSKIFGYLPLPYQILTWIIIFTIDFSIFKVVYKIAGNYYQAFSALFFFVVFSIPFGVNGLWFDLAQTPIIVFSVYYFYNYTKYQKKQDLQKSFFLVIFAFFIKQQVLWLIIFYLGFLIIFQKDKFQKLKKILLLQFAVFSLIFLIQIVFFYKQGTLNDFLFWTVYQPLFRGSSLPGYVSLPTLKQLAILALPYFLVAHLTIFSKEKKLFITLLALPLIMFAYPRFDYFHLIPYLAIVAVSLGVHLKGLRVNHVLLPIGFLFLLSIFAIHQYRLFWDKPIRFFERDVLTAASLIEAVTPQNGIIYIQNGPDQLLPLSGRLSVKPWAIQFPWY